MRLDRGKSMRKLLVLASVFALLTIGNTGAWALGPSFDCSSAQQPGAQLICASPDLSRTELSLLQTYNALTWQVGQAGAPSLRQDYAIFATHALQQCGVPQNGRLPLDTAVMAACMQRAYERQRDTWLSRLAGAASEEATRRLEVHITLQRALQQSGFLASSELTNGVYGPATRTAISAWQHANRRPETGILSNADAAILLAGPPAATAAAPATVTVPPMAQSTGQPAHASWPVMDTADDAGESPFSLSGLKDMAARYWDRTGSGGLFMALGAVVLIAGLGGMIRPSRRGGRKPGSPARIGTQQRHSAGSYGSGPRRAPQLMVWGLLIALSGACVAYGPTTVYQTVEQALTSVFA